MPVATEPRNRVPVIAPDANGQGYREVRADTDLTDVMQQYADTVWRVCALYLKQKADAEDAFQNTFVRYATSTTTFESEEHRKAWLIRVAANICKDHFKASARNEVSFDPLDDERTHPPSMTEEFPEESDVLHALKSLPENYRSALYLTYYEGYTAAEIGTLLNLPANTVYTNISRGKKLLKEVLEHG